MAFTYSLSLSPLSLSLSLYLSFSHHQNDQMRQDISDYKMQMQTQRENIVSRRGEDAEFKDKIGKKNKELAETMEELQNISDARTPFSR